MGIKGKKSRILTGHEIKETESLRNYKTLAPAVSLFFKLCLPPVASVRIALSKLSQPRA